MTMNASNSAERNSILIVDDESLNITALNHILGGDYTIFVEKHGKDAFEAAKELSPDLIILDIIMPEMDGFEIIATLKGNHDTREIPVIFITGLGGPESEERGLALGAVDYIHKPFNPAIVKLRVRNQLQIVNQMRMINHLSITDTLTNTANRRHFNTRLNYEWQRSIRERTPLSLFLIDVDRFKNYNDTYGHLQGDVALRSIADSIGKRLYRTTDLLARWGGEEFAVLLPNTHAQGARIVAEDIRASIEKGVFPFGDIHTYLTVSIGANCIVPGQQNCMDFFVQCADKALYDAKNSGRNKVVIYDQAE